MSPFWIFGVGVQLVLLGTLFWIIFRVAKFLRKSKKWGKDMDALLWARCIMDPDGPSRPKKEDIGKYRFNRKPGQGRRSKKRTLAVIVFIVVTVSFGAWLSVWTVSSLDRPSAPVGGPTTTIKFDSGDNVRYETATPTDVYLTALNNSLGHVAFNFTLSRTDSLPGTKSVAFDIHSDYFMVDTTQKYYIVYAFYDFNGTTVSLSCEKQNCGTLIDIPPGGNISFSLTLLTQKWSEGGQELVWMMPEGGPTVHVYADNTVSLPG